MKDNENGLFKKEKALLYNTLVEEPLFADFLRSKSNLSLPYWKGAKPLRTTDRLLKIQFKRPYLVSQAFVIVSQLSRAWGPLRIRKSEEHAATKEKDGPLRISFFPEGKKKEVPPIMVNLSLWSGWGKCLPAGGRIESEFP